MCTAVCCSQEARVWAGTVPKGETLDYSDKGDGVRGVSDADSGAESVNLQEKSLVDMAEEYDSEQSEVALSHRDMQADRLLWLLLYSTSFLI